MIKAHIGRIGGCPRALALHMFGVPDIEATDKATRKIYSDGEEIERHVIAELRDEGYKVTNGVPYHKVVEVDGVKVKLIGTPDAMLALKKDYPAEIKSMNYWRFRNLPDKFSLWEDKLKDKYSYQMGGYLFITEKPWIYFICKEKKNKKLDGDLKILRVFPEELKTPEEILLKIKIALRIFKGEEVLPSNFYNCKYCSVNDSTKDWYESPCTKSYVDKKSKHKSQYDKPFIKQYKLLAKDIKEREEDIAELKKRKLQYERMLTIKFGKEWPI